MIFDDTSLWHPVPGKNDTWFMATTAHRTKNNSKKLKGKIRENNIKGTSVRVQKSLIIISGDITTLASTFGIHLDTTHLTKAPELYEERVKETFKFIWRGDWGDRLFIKDESNKYVLWEAFDYNKEGQLLCRYTAQTSNLARCITKNLNHAGVVGKVCSKYSYVVCTLDTLQQLDAKCQRLRASELKTNKIKKAISQAIMHSGEARPSPVSAPPLTPELYWYEDVEMNLILLHAIANREYRSIGGMSIDIKGPFDNLSPYGLARALIEHEKKEGILLIPFNIGLLHWVGLELVYTGGILISANYYDPMGGKVPAFLNLILKEIDHGVLKWTAVKDERLIRQVNGSDCGPCTIESLLAAVGYKESATTTVAERRQRHLDLLAIAEPEFYVDFSMRQATNTSSFSKLEHSSKLTAPLAKHMGVKEYIQLMKLALAILKTDPDVKDVIIKTIQPEDKTELAMRIKELEAYLRPNLIRIVGLYDIAQALFHFAYEMDPKTVSLKMEYEQIQLLKSIMIAFTAEELEAQLKENNEFPLGVIPDLVTLDNESTETGIDIGLDDESMGVISVGESPLSTEQSREEGDVPPPSPTKRPRLDVCESLRKPADDNSNPRCSSLWLRSTSKVALPSPGDTIAGLRYPSIFTSLSSAREPTSPIGSVVLAESTSACGVGTKRPRGW